MVQLVRIFDALPDDFPILRAAATAEGFCHIERLAADWVSGLVRFDGEGEVLFAAYVGGALAGIGGMTIEPADASASRMRRFYVRPDFRAQGVARALAGALMQEAAHARRGMTVNAASTSTGFWLALGFVADARLGWTHRLPAVG